MYLTSIDELLAYLMLGLGFLDCIVNQKWKQYAFMWILLGIMFFYSAYSLFVVHFNKPQAFFMDFIIQTKPYIPIAVILAIKPKFNNADKKWIKHIALFNCTILSICLLLGNAVTEAVVFHPTYAGIIILISALFYLYCCIRPDGSINKHDITIVVIFLTAGLLCARAKYFGVYVLAIYFLFLYKPGIMKHFNATHAVGMIALLLIILAVSWHKIEYYFFTGNADSFDPNTVQTFARPVLYVTGFQILVDYFPFGSGFASFATAASADYYSNVYYEYGIDKVHGLAPNLDFNFICDTFFPALAEFGVVGLILFIYFWVWCYGFLRRMIRSNTTLYKTKFIIGSIIILFLMIENVASATFSGNCGFIAMMLLALTCIPGLELKYHESKETNDRPTEVNNKIGQRLRTKRIKI